MGDEDGSEAKPDRGDHERNAEGDAGNVRQCGESRKSGPKTRP
jgi:hypothetical protein